MKNIGEFIKSNILITDGAMGTYYSQITGSEVHFCEEANINNGETIKKIHNEYIKAGAKLIRTNTFAANIFSMNIDCDTRKNIIETGYNIAKEAAGETIYIAASIGPIPDNVNGKEIEIEKIYDEYKTICNIFLKNAGT